MIRENVRHNRTPDSCSVVVRCIRILSYHVNYDKSANVGRCFAANVGNFVILSTVCHQFRRRCPLLVTRASGGQRREWGGLLQHFGCPTGSYIEVHRRPDKKAGTKCVTRPVFVLFVDESSWYVLFVWYNKIKAAKNGTPSQLLLWPLLDARVTR